MEERKSLLGFQEQAAYDEYNRAYHRFLMDELIIQVFLYGIGACAMVLGLRNAVLLLEPTTVEKTVLISLFVLLMFLSFVGCVFGATRSYKRELELRRKRLPEHRFLLHYRRGDVPDLREKRQTDHHAVCH